MFKNCQRTNYNEVLPERSAEIQHLTVTSKQFSYRKGTAVSWKLSPAKFFSIYLYSELLLVVTRWNFIKTFGVSKPESKAYHAALFA